MFISEEEWCIIYLWIAEIFVELVAWGMRDPVFGLVFLWAGAAAIQDSVEERPEDENLLINLSVIAGVHLISMLSLISYLGFEKFQPWYEPISFWSGGTFGKTDWAEMFTDINWVLKHIEIYISEAYDDRVESA